MGTGEAGTARLVVTVADGRGARRDVDVLLDADLDAPLADALPMLVAALGEHVHPSFVAHLPVWVDGAAAEPANSLRGNGLADGSVVALHAPAGGGDAVAGPSGAPEVRVVAGPGAGRVHRLPLGRTELGCGGRDVTLPDVLLPADALVVTATPDGTVTVAPGPGAAGTDARLDGEPLTGPVPWPPGSYLRAGDTVLERASGSLATLRVRPAADGPGAEVNRPPRLLPAVRPQRFTRPTEPKEPARRAIPWLAVLAPVVIAVPMAFFFQPYFLLFAAMSPLMALANWFSERRGGRATYRTEHAAWAVEDARVLGLVAQARTDERAARRDALADPALGLLTALGPGTRLWERRRRDDDHLRLRVGLGALPSTVEVISGPVAQSPAGQSPAGPLADVPVAVDLRRLGVVGIAGDTEVTAALGRWLVAQTALLHSPRDVRLVVLAGGGVGGDWSWTRWLPHLRSDTADGLPSLVGTDAATIGRRIAELTALIDRRRATTGSGLAVTQPPPAPDVVVVLDGARRLRGLPGVPGLLSEGPAVGVHVLCLEDDVRALPPECAGVVECGPRRVTVRESRADAVPDVVPDLVEPAWALRVARALAPLRDATPDDEQAGLPSARLLDLLGLDPVTPEAVLAGWSAGGTTDVVLGAGFDGPLRVDLRRDGPHALVAGTTGSGKSELLQTLVASLALANRPDELTFVLVDYKGGSAFKDCARLPHTVGLVTDLDAHLVQRALASLGAELKRREHLLAVAGAKDLEDYVALGATPALPRLVLVIDEFAGLVGELPDFVKGLVGIAQRGRSLGLHLVLATQRPSGVVSPEIRANTALRISLRVTDDAESRDVVDAPDAARIPRTTPGRGYVRTGHSVLLPFQAGRVGGRRPGGAPPGGAPAGSRGPGPAAQAWVLPFERAGLPAPARRGTDPPTTDEAGTDLSDLVSAVRSAAARLGVATQPSPWLPALPDAVLLDDLPPAAGGAVAWALEDRPAAQAQVAATFAPGADGHLYVVGAPRSGRSTALRTLVAALARSLPPTDLHVHAIDCGSGALLALDALPHTGVVAVRTAPDRVDRLLRRLTDEVTHRQQVLAAGGYADVGEQRAAEPADRRLPYVVLALDRWEGFVPALGELDGGRLTDAVLLLLREGASVGVHLLVSGDRSLLSGRMATLVERRLVLRLADRTDYALAGIAVRDVPETMPDGRGLWSADGAEVQVALLPGDPSGQGQAQALAALAATLPGVPADAPAAHVPFRLGLLPAEVPAAQVWPAFDVAAADAPGGARWVPLGIGGDALDLHGLDLSGTAVAVVAGPARSGRTAALRFAVAAAVRRGSRVLAVCPRGGPLADAVAAASGVVVGESSPDAFADALRALPAGSLVAVDDAELLRESPLVPVLTALMRQAREKGWGVLVAGETSQLASGLSGWVADARRGRQGLLLSPQTLLDGEAVGARLARSALVASVHPGRGLLVAPGAEPLVVQVPLV